jgi:membrane protein DedA with SNARE-associated domain
VGTVAATVGDNVGYAIGNYGGRPLLERYRNIFRISDTKLARGEKLFNRSGPVTILFARFVFGMRVIAGPLAGVLRMNWKRFAVFNFLGAAFVGKCNFLRVIFLWKSLESVDPFHQAV